MKMFFRDILLGLGFVLVMLMGLASGARFVKKRNLDEVLQVSTSSGIVQGRTNRTFNGRPFWSFRGIPYARPPVGAFRFRTPKPAESWERVLDATKEGPACVEILLRPQGVLTSGTEDCLILNVFTPMDPQYSRDPLPVLVWFYGGAFMEGNSQARLYGPEFLLDEDVVVVTLNYRIGLFGFLSTDDSASPGNYGLKDQLLALRWIQKNIRNFGGDPSRVTISGQSAGAASVLYHMASPKSKGLFHRVIANSGSSISGFARKRNAREIAFKVGVGLGINTKSSKELVSKLRMVDLEKLKAVTQTLATLGSLTLVQEGFPFGPVIEYNHKDAFISESTYSLLENGNFYKVPLIIGITTDESAFFESYIKNIQPLTIIFDLSPGSLPNPSMNIGSLEERRNAGKEIINHYFKRGSAIEGSVEEIEDLVSDDMFLRPARKTAQLALKYIPVYFYVFSYRSKYGLRGLNDENKMRRLGRGVAHVEDTTYFWKKGQRSYPQKPEDRLMVSRMVKLWSNFARTGNPTPKREDLLENITWPTVDSPTDIKYLDIDSTLSIKSNFRDEHMRFWDSIYDKYGGKSYITY